MADTPSPLSGSRKRRHSVGEEDGNAKNVRDKEERNQKWQIKEHIAGRALTHRYSNLALNMALAFIDFEDERDRSRFKIDALKRWDHPLQRGTAGGRREMIVASEFERWEAGKPRPPLFFAAWDVDDWNWDELQEVWNFKYEGPATIWGTLNQQGELVVRAWPDGWDNPVAISDETRARLAWTLDMGAFAASVKRADAIARAFENAERSTDPNRCITRDEARLIETYVSSYKLGLKFIKHAGWLDFHSGERNRWQEERQAQGKLVWRRLQDAYGPLNLPSKETLAIAAVLTEQATPEYLDDAQRLKWLDESYYDAMLILIHTRIWCTTVDSPARNSIQGFPFDRGSIPLALVDNAGKEKPGVRDLLDEWKELCNKRIVTTTPDLKRLGCASPIAAKSLESRLRHHKDETGIPVQWDWRVSYQT
ncbi:hypothetical protein CBER1_07726 [Cercospora berteroae]|uniref:Uncharacterized protein n=1 Tax=Cercospora berteroae TaxID=357750 RepID=A0A2S6BSR0_9PEZI|nr:hypothetical protein CBER1_07726 [Cercospora berteroae]